MKLFWLDWNAEHLIKDSALRASACVWLYQQVGSKESVQVTTFDCSAVSKADLSILKLTVLAKMRISFLQDPGQRNKVLNWDQKAWVLILSFPSTHLTALANLLPKSRSGFRFLHL